MKIIEGDEDYIYLRHYGCPIPHDIILEPLEAYQLGILLIKLANETDYFKGLKKDD